MELLTAKIMEDGWWLAIKFAEKGSDKKNIVQAVWFPKIDHERAMKNFFNNHPNTTHNFGEIFVEGVVRTIPQEIRPRLKDSMFWERQREAGKVVGLPGSNDKYQPVQDENTAFMRMGLNSPLTKKYPKTYVKTSQGWIPAILRPFYQQFENAEKKIAAEKKFNEEFSEGLKNGTAMNILRKNTISFDPEIAPEKEYEVMTIPAFPNASETDLKDGAGCYNYGRIAQYMGR